MADIAIGRVHVIGRADVDRVEVLGLLVEQLPPVLVEVDAVAEAFASVGLGGRCPPRRWRRTSGSDARRGCRYPIPPCRPAPKLACRTRRLGGCDIRFGTNKGAAMVAAAAFFRTSGGWNEALGGLREGRVGLWSCCSEQTRQPPVCWRSSSGPEPVSEGKLAGEFDHGERGAAEKPRNGVPKIFVFS